MDNFSPSSTSSTLILCPDVLAAVLLSKYPGERALVVTGESEMLRKEPPKAHVSHDI
jgi:hypothetical protein